MKKSFFSSILIALFLAGCVRSIYPLFMENDLVYKDELLGVWKEKEGKNTWIFEKGTGKNYILLHHEAEFTGSPGSKIPGDTAKFAAQLGKLGKYFFLDIYPESPNTKVKNDFFNFHLLPLHTISRIWIGADTLRLSMLDNDWLARMIDSRAFRIKHARLNDQLILTASTQELQRLAVRYAENKKAFPRPGELYRVK